MNRHALFSLLTIVFITCPLLGQTTRPADQPMKASLISGTGEWTHVVSTKSPEAQQFFNQGLALLYGFNHDEAMRSFIRASELDPNLGMAHWGIALSLGPNYNVPVDLIRELAAYEHIQKAMLLAKDAPQPERDYIAALARRYSNDPKADLKQLDRDYRAAMKELVAKYPDDLDAAVLYAESMMMLRPWMLWSYDGKPAEDTPEIVATIESVLKRDSDHLGANHFYIHAVEASRHPEWALEAAGRLPGLAPAMGHLVHMPAHIYGRVGDHEAAIGSNLAAVEVDEAYLKSRNDNGIYPMMYYSHNIHFLAYSYSMQGRFEDAMKNALKVRDHAGPHAAHMQMMEVFAIAPDLVLARFGKWDEILKLPEPSQGLQVSRMSWHIVRGIALARTGAPDPAERERAAVKKLGEQIPETSMFGMLNPASKILPLADTYLAARIAQARGDRNGAIALWKTAAEQEDALNYDEPPSWWLHAREPLGAALLMNGNPADAEQVFRKELDWNPRSGRALFGVLESLRAQKKDYEASLIQRQLDEAWKRAQLKLTIEEF